MDLSAIKPHSVELPIKHPATGQATGLVLEVVSEYDDRVKAAERVGRQTIMAAGSTTPELVDDLYRSRMAAHVIGWRWDGEANWGGDKLKFTPENVARVLSNDMVREQLAQAVEKRAAFFA